MKHFDLLDTLYAAGMTVRKPSQTLRWQDGSKISAPEADWNINMFGNHAQ
jgi:hypothetical protein